MQIENYHTPVLLNESCDGLNIEGDGVFLDLTFGGGGHSCEILRRMNENSVLLGFDQDEDTFANIPDDERFIWVNHNFKYLKNFIRYHGYAKVDGILADLGVSSHEFDEAERGFSFRFDAELDMRMSRKRDLTAVKVLNEYVDDQLVAVFKNYGEVDNARRLVSFIVKNRELAPIITSSDFYKAIEPCIPKQKEKKYLAKVYQALRIEVNGELDVLKDMLVDAVDVLKPK